MIRKPERLPLNKTGFNRRQNKVKRAICTPTYLQSYAQNVYIYVGKPVFLHCQGTKGVPFLPDDVDKLKIMVD